MDPQTSAEEFAVGFGAPAFRPSLGYGGALLPLVLAASLIVFAPVRLPRPVMKTGIPAVTTGQPGVAGNAPTLPPLNPKSTIALRSAPTIVPPVSRRPEPINVPDRIVSNTLVHAARRGENVASIARRYLPQTAYMTAAELEAAIRQASAAKWERSPSPGDDVVVPGYESAPIVERVIPVAKGYEVRAIYLTGLMAGSHQGIELIRRWKQLGGNAIVFDIKDSDGSVSVPFDHELAPRLHPYVPNLPKFARFMHQLGLHSIARIAVFRDEQLVKHHPQLAVQSRRSQRPWRENGKLVWTDPSRPEVQKYDIALAKLAATSGIDEVQFDYIRFPAEGDQKDAQFFFQTAHPDWKRTQVITDFLSRAYSELHPLGVLVSLDVFGVMAWQRPVDLAHTGQDIPAMARFCDVLSPMIYPSHFFGMDGYASPGDAPEHFIGTSMERFQEITADTGVVLRPWLQAFGWRTKTYSAAYILTQVRVAQENDGIGYLFWNARNDYSKPFIAMTQLRALPDRYSTGDTGHGKRNERFATSGAGRESALHPVHRATETVKNRHAAAEHAEH